MLLVLLLGVADFARVFAAGITLEAATRDGAEAAAVERLRAGRPAMPGDSTYYERLHLIAARAACAESRTLPNVTYVADDPSTPSTNEESCPSDFADSTASNDGPVFAVCVLDDVGAGGDPGCGSVVPWVTGGLPPGCAFLSGGWNAASGGATSSHSIRVRTCYHFTTLFNLNLSLPFGWSLALGDVWLHQDRVFVVDCPPGDVSTC
jgi:hypothetical protein